ncbi:choice-of-anchor D domain-containing protein, partial [bacterium]|nr:choice-of-anchor D domain-containing protein [bacterium]
TTKTSFSSTSDWIALANISQVYTGSFTAPATAGWVEIVLDTPFTYDGTSNLVIGFDENTQGYHSSGDEFYCYATASNRSIYYYSDSTNPNPASPVTGNLSGNNPNIRIFASSTVAEAEIALSTTSLDFGEVILGNSVTSDFTITNIGGSNLSGTITLPDNFSFASRNSEKEVVNTRTASQNFSLPAGNNQTYSVTFTPTVELCYNSNVTISHNADQYPSYISLVACGIKPAYSSTTRLISKTLAPDTQGTYNYVINNTGSGDLEVLVEITDAERNSGGPDTYGYTWKDINEAGVTYDWIDISSTGTVVSEGDDTIEAITLPFTFSFYGEEYTEVYVCSNGFLSFTSTSTAYTNANIPNSTVPNALIAPFWDDLKPTGAEWGNVYYKNFSTYSIVQWENVSHFNSSNPTNNETFQVILYNNGDIKYQYHTVALNTSCTVGIENQAGDDGLLINYNSAFLVSEYAILITTEGVTPNWLSINNDNLVIPEGGSETITVSFDATDLELGTYNKNLYLISNDPENEEITIPVTLIVGGTSEPNILVNTEAIDFGSVTTGDFVMETITITNIGGETLTGNINADNNFTITEARANVSKNEIMSAHQASRRVRNFDFSLASGATKSYDVSHSTATAASYSGDITITSNDPESSLITVPLTLEVIDPAQINVNPQSLALSLQPEQSADRTISISNTGDLDLTCSLNLQITEAREVTEIFTANFDDHNLSDWSIDFLYSADHTWHIADSYGSSSLDGSSFLFINSDAAGSGVDLDDTIETPTCNVSAYEEITIEFDHYFNAYQEEIADVDFWTGSEWINIGRWQNDDIGAWSAPVQFTHTLTNNGYTDVKLRFHYYEANYDWFWAIDNLVISGLGTPAPQWVTLPSEFTNLTVTPDTSQDITLNFSSVDFVAGQYTASLNIQSNSALNNSLSIPITLTISELENEPDWQPVIYPNNSATIYAEVTHLSDEIADDDIIS